MNRQTIHIGMALLMAGVASWFVGCGCSSSGGALVGLATADLLPSSIRWDPSAPHVNNNIDLITTVSNRGSFDARAFSVTVFIVRNPCKSNERVVANRNFIFPYGLRSNDVGSMIWRVRLGSGSHGVRVHVDPENAISEGTADYDGKANNIFNCNEISDFWGRTYLRETSGRVFINGTSRIKASPDANG